MYRICSLGKDVQTPYGQEEEVVQLKQTFQLEWDIQIAKMCSELGPQDRERLSLPAPPYTEHSVALFCQQHKRATAQQTALGNVLSFWEAEVPPQTRTGRLLQALRKKTHPAMLVRLIRAGAFQMGGDDETDARVQADERPRHTVRLTRSFEMGIHPVTTSQWSDIMRSSWFPSASRDPIEVTWEEAICFCNALSEAEGLTKAYTGEYPNVHCDFDGEGYRLPTEAEWEYVARANEKTLYSGGNVLRSVANWKFPRDKAGRAVCQRQPNGFGLYDMSGNVWEWCWDWYDIYAERDRSFDPTGPLNKQWKVRRGGAYNSPQYELRVSNRGHLSPHKKEDTGFRICRTVREK